MKPLREIKSRPLPWWVMCIAGLAGSLAWTSLSRVFAPLAPGGYADLFRAPEVALLRVALPMALVGAALAAWLAVTGRLRAALVQREPRRPGGWSGGVLVAGALVPVAVAVFGLVRRGLGEASWALLAAALVAVLAVGFCEELFFRGFVLTEARRSLSEGASLALTCGLFGLWHAPNVLLGSPFGSVLIQVVLTSVIAVLLYCVVRVTGRLWPAMLLHGLWDFAVVGI